MMVQQTQPVMQQLLYPQLAPQLAPQPQYAQIQAPTLLGYSLPDLGLANYFK